MRRLIINADDLGLTPGVNRGILEAHGHGVVTSTTLMANSAGFSDAVRGLRSAPKLSVGCHVVLIDGEPLLGAAQVPSLLAPTNNSRPRFRQSFAEFGAAVFRHRLHPEEIVAEAAEQMRKLTFSGIRLSHFDTHKHVHMFGAVLRPLLRAAQSCGVRAVRNPFAPLKPLAFAHLLRRPHLWTRYSEVRILRGLGSQFRHMVAEEGLVTTDGTFGIVSTGALDERLFRAIVGCIPEGTWELVCHPGYNDDELARVPTRLRASRRKELEVLTSYAAKRALEEAGVELISYEELTHRGIDSFSH